MVFRTLYRLTARSSSAASATRQITATASSSRESITTLDLAHLRSLHQAETRCGRTSPGKMGEPQIGQTYRFPLGEPRNWVPPSLVRCGVRAHTLWLRALRDPQLPVGHQPPRDPHLPGERKLFRDPHLPEEREPCRHGRDLPALAGGPWGASDGAVLLASAGEVTELG